MKKTAFFLTICLLLAFSAGAQQPTASHFDGQSWWGYVKVLADDNMEGRETGSAGLRRAEAYIVEQLRSDGLEPAGSKGFYQPVKFESRQIIEKDSSLALVRDGKAQTLTLGDDAIFSTRVDLAPSVEAPLVFVGYGLTVPEMNYDDLAGLDLKGKVVVMLAGAPDRRTRPPAPKGGVDRQHGYRDHHQRGAERRPRFRQVELRHRAAPRNDEARL